MARENERTALLGGKKAEVSKGPITEASALLIDDINRLFQALKSNAAHPKGLLRVPVAKSSDAIEKNDRTLIGAALERNLYSQVVLLLLMIPSQDLSKSTMKKLAANKGALFSALQALSERDDEIGCYLKGTTFPMMSAQLEDASRRSSIPFIRVMAFAGTGLFAPKRDDKSFQQLRKIVGATASVGAARENSYQQLH